MSDDSPSWDSGTLSSGADGALGEVAPFVADLGDARNGSREALGRLLDNLRTSLWLLADTSLDSRLRPKVGASDIVQLTLLEANLGFSDFQGDSSAEFTAWVKRILANNVLNEFRKWRGTQKRQIRREIPLHGGQSGELSLDGQQDTPSAIVACDERATQLHLALSRLPDDCQVAIRLRHFHGATFAELGRRLGRSEDAARMLWYRAFDRLARKLAEAGHAG